MKIKLIIPLLGTLLVIIMTVSSMSGRFEYAGVESCARCHSMEELGNQNAVWQGSPHARAYRLLSTEKAKQISAKSGIDDPSESLECLKCHTTGGGRFEKVRGEGVGCEACHGPGSIYQEAGIHVDYADRKRGYARAIRNGMYPILGDRHLKNREKVCLSCHTPQRPCIPGTSQELLLKKMTIQTVDRLIRGDVKLDHPLRR